MRQLKVMYNLQRFKPSFYARNQEKSGIHLYPDTLNSEPVLQNHLSQQVQLQVFLGGVEVSVCFE